MRRREGGVRSFAARFVPLAAFLVAVVLPFLPAPAVAAPPGFVGPQGGFPVDDPEATPVRFTLPMVDKDGNTVMQPIEIQGNIDGELLRFLREHEARNPSPPLPPPATPTPDATRSPAPPATATPDEAGSEEARHLYLQAQRLFRSGTIEPGRELLTRLFEEHPTSRWAGEGHVARGRQAEYAGQWSEALEHLTHFTVDLCHFTRRCQAALAAAEALAMLDRYEDARTFARKARDFAVTPQQRDQTQRLFARMAVLGRPAPTLKVEAVFRGDGTESTETTSEATPIALDIPEGRVVWIDFFQIDCPHGSKAYPKILELADMARSGGAVFYSVGVDPYGSVAPETETGSARPTRDASEIEPFREYLARYPRPGTAAVDFARRTSFLACGGRGFPWSVVIDRRGVVRYAGVFNETKVEETLMKTLGEDPEALRAP